MLEGNILVNDAQFAKFFPANTVKLLRPAKIFFAICFVKILSLQYFPMHGMPYHCYLACS